MLKKIIAVIRTLFPTAARRYPMFFVMEGLKTLISILQPFLGILVTPLLVDELCNARNVERIVQYVAIIVVGECLLQTAASWLDTVLQKYQQRLDNYFSMQMGMHSMGLDFQLTEDKKALDQLEKAKTGMAWYSGGVYGIAEQVFMFFGNCFKIGGFVTLIVVNAPVLLAVILVYALIGLFITNKCNKIELAAYGSLAKLNRLFSYFGWEIVDFRYGKDIRLYQARKLMLHKWKMNTDASIGVWRQQGDSAYPYQMLRSAADVVRQLITYAYVAILAIRKVFSIGIFTQMIETAGALDATLGGLTWNITELIKRCNYAYEYVLFMEYPEAIPKGTAHVEKKQHRIEFRNVAFSYPGTDKKVLDGINITVEPGEHLSIVGLNGAGKTTTFYMTVGLVTPNEGKIFLNDMEITKFPVYKRARNGIGYLAQEASIFRKMTVEDNIRSVLEMTGRSIEYQKEKLESLISEFGLNKVRKNLGDQLSGGERRRAEIARCLAIDPKFIMLDEPFAGVDPIAVQDIQTIVARLKHKNIGILITDHNVYETLSICDRAYLLFEGKVLFQGTAEQLAENEIVREKYLGKDFVLRKKDL